MTILSTLLHATHFSSPFLRTLVPSISLAYGIQGLVAVPSILAQSEKFYDLSGSLTYLSCTALSLYLPAIRARYAAGLAGTIKPGWPSLVGALMGRAGSGLNWRQILLSAAVSFWATRRKLQSSRLQSHRYAIDSVLPGFENNLTFAQWEPISSPAFPPTAMIPASTISAPLRQSSWVPSSPKRRGCRYAFSPFWPSTPFHQLS